MAPWARQQVQAWERTTNGGGARTLRKPRLSPFLPASLIPWLPPYQIGSKAQVAHSQQSYKAKEGRVREAGQVADHKVEVDGADEGHDAGGDDFAQPGGRKDPEGWLDAWDHLDHLPTHPNPQELRLAQNWGQRRKIPSSLTCVV